MISALRASSKRFVYCSVNRYYDPATAVFLTVDPLVGATREPYDYAGQDPIDNRDLDGNCWTGFCWAKHAADVVWKKKGEIAREGGILVTATAAGVIATAACGGNVACGVAAGIFVRALVTGALEKAEGASNGSAIVTAGLAGLLGLGEAGVAWETAGRGSVDFATNALAAKVAGKSTTRITAFGGGYILRGPRGKFVGVIHCLFC